MAKCDEGYRCDHCGEDVDSIVESSLYLRYILGEVPLDRLHRLPERHLRCDPSLTQYITDERFPTVVCEGPFDKAFLDPEYVAQTERRVTRAWQRLQQIPTLGLTIPEYPLPASEDEL